MCLKIIARVIYRVSVFSLLLYLAGCNLCDHQDVLTHSLELEPQYTTSTGFVDPIILREVDGRDVQLIDEESGEDLLDFFDVGISSRISIQPQEELIVPDYEVGDGDDNTQLRLSLVLGQVAVHNIVIDYFVDPMDDCNDRGAVLPTYIRITDAANGNVLVDQAIEADTDNFDIIVIEYHI